MPITRLVPALLALAVVTTVPACGQAGPLNAGMRKVSGASQARGLEQEPQLIRSLALDAHQALLDTEAAYSVLKLDTAAGRKLDAKREAAVREGLRPVVAKLDVTAVAIAKALSGEDASSKLATLGQAFSQRAPNKPEDALPADAPATALLYRVAQYRLKLSFLVEYALRRGLVVDLPQAPVEPKKPAGDQPADD